MLPCNDPKPWLAVLAGTLTGSLAFAQTPATNSQPYRLDTVVVTGIADGPTPASGNATTFSAATLTDRVVTSPRELTTLVPNLAVFDANGDRLPRFSMRGVRENNFGYGESAVSVYVDDVPYYDQFSRGVPLYNVESADFLPGPQGTVLGASRPGGVLNLFTRLPGNDWHGNAQGSFGNFDAVSLSAGVSGPVVKDQLFLGVDGLFAKRNGYFYNTTTLTHPDSRETLAGRIQLRWTPAERLDFTATFGVDRFHDGALVARPLNWTGGFYDLSQDAPGYNYQSSHTYSLRGAWTGEKVRVVNVLARRDWRQDLSGDFDFSPFPVVTGFDHPKLGQWSEELRAESVDEDARLRWSAGAFAASRDVNRLNGVAYGPFAGPLAGATDSNASILRDLDLALFGQVTWTPVEKLDLTAGLRGEYDERTLSRNHLNPMVPPFLFTGSQNADFRSLQPKATLAYHVTPNLQTWFTFSTGYQPGGFTISPDDPSKARYAPAESLNFELGASATWLDGKLATSVRGFWTETHDYQVYRPTSLTDFQVLNAPKARTLGAEGELRLRPAEGWDLRVAGGLSEAEFRRFTVPDPVTGAPVDLAGKTINFVPEFTLDATASYRHSSGWFASFGVGAVGRYWFDELNTNQQSAYALLHARAGWGNQNLEVAFFGRNMLDQHYYANALDFGPSGGVVVTPGDPAIFGAEVSAKF